MVSLSFPSLIYFNFVCADLMMKGFNGNLLSIFIIYLKILFHCLLNETLLRAQREKTDSDGSFH